MFKINDAMVVLSGKVTKIDEGKAYHLTLEYNAYEDGKVVKKETTVSFWNNEATEEKEATLFADKARKLKIKEGSFVTVLCKPKQGDDTQATGYRVTYNGIIKYNNNGRYINFLTGLITWMRSITNQQGEEILRLGLYMGKNEDGSFKSAVITIPHKSTERAKKYFDGVKENRINAMFMCGDEFVANGNDGNTFSMYTAFAFEGISKTPRN